jgi:hypothetical protein
LNAGEPDPFLGDRVSLTGSLVRDRTGLTVIFATGDVTRASFLASLSATSDAPSAGETEEGAPDARGRAGDAAEGPGPPRSPNPDREPQMPTAPGASGGSGSSGGHAGSTVSLAAAARDLTPRDNARPVTPIEVRLLAPHLVFLLERPG